LIIPLEGCGRHWAALSSETAINHTTKLLVALRGNKELYQEALETYYKINT